MLTSLTFGKSRGKRFTYLAGDSIHGFLISASGDRVPGLDCLVVADSDEAFPIWHICDAANNAVVSQKRASARPLAKIPRSHLAVVGAAQKSGQLQGMFTHAWYRILVALQAGHKRLGEHPLQLNGVQRLRVLPGRLKGVQGGIEVSWDYKR